MLLNKWDLHKRAAMIKFFGRLKKKITHIFIVNTQFWTYKAKQLQIYSFKNLTFFDHVLKWGINKQNDEKQNELISEICLINLLHFVSWYLSKAAPLFLASSVPLVLGPNDIEPLQPPTQK